MQQGCVFFFFALIQQGLLLVVIAVHNGVHGDNFLLGGGCSWTRYTLEYVQVKWLFLTPCVYYIRRPFAF